MRKVINYTLYPLGWLFTIYASSFIIGVSTSSGLTWYYNATPGYGDYTANIEYYVSFPDITEKMFFLIWFIGFAITCFTLVLLIDGISKRLNSGERPFSNAFFAVTQAAAAILYLVVGVLTGYNGNLYFFTVFFKFVLNKFSPRMITTENEFLIVTFINIGIVLVFVITSVVMYQRERNRRLYVLERERLHKEEMINEIES